MGDRQGAVTQANLYVNKSYKDSCCNYFMCPNFCLACDQHKQDMDITFLV